MLTSPGETLETATSIPGGMRRSSSLAKSTLASLDCVYAEQKGVLQSLYAPGFSRLMSSKRIVPFL